MTHGDQASINPTEEDEWNGNSKPKCENSQHGHEGNRAGGAVCPHDDIQSKEGHKQDTTHISLARTQAYTTESYPGKRVAVRIVHRCHCLPWKVLYNLAEVKPAKAPIKTKNRSMPIIIDPRLAGDKNPTAAKMTSKNAQMESCTPVPMRTQNNIG